MDNRTIEEIRKNETELIKILDYQTDKLDQYKNNWEELKKCINHYAIDEEDGSKIYSVEEIELLEILDKMKELEGDK
jgi:hypothetical protein